MHSSFHPALYEDLIPPTEPNFALYLEHRYNMSVPPGRGRHGRERMVVEFATTYAISAYHYLCCEIESRSGQGVQQYVTKFVSDLRQVGGFLRVLRFPLPIKLTATTYC